MASYNDMFPGYGPLDMQPPKEEKKSPIKRAARYMADTGKQFAAGTADVLTGTAHGAADMLDQVGKNYASNYNLNIPDTDKDLSDYLRKGALVTSEFADAMGEPTDFIQTGVREAPLAIAQAYGGMPAKVLTFLSGYGNNVKAQEDAGREGDDVNRLASVGTATTGTLLGALRLKALEGVTDNVGEVKKALDWRKLKDADLSTKLSNRRRDIPSNVKRLEGGALNKHIATTAGKATGKASGKIAAYPAGIYADSAQKDWFNDYAFEDK